MPEKALIVVDVQYDFLPGGALAVQDGDQIIPVINALMPRYDLVIATRDWHPRNHASFAANHPGASVGQMIDLNGLPQILWPVHCVQETRGAELSHELDLGRIQKTIFKGTDPAIDSYSGFFDNGHRKETELHDFLQQAQVTAIDVVGLATDYCVKFTALDGLKLGYDVTLITSACRGVNLIPGDVDQAVESMRLAGVKVIERIPPG